MKILGLQGFSLQLGWGGTPHPPPISWKVTKSPPIRVTQFVKFSACGINFYKSLQFMNMKVCQWQKHFSLPLKFWKFPQQWLVSVEAYQYVKNLTSCFESLWTRLTIFTSDEWINVSRLLLLYHMQKTNFITQFIIEIKLTHCLFSHWPCPVMPEPTNLKQLLFSAFLDL